MEMEVEAIALASSYVANTCQTDSTAGGNGFDLGDEMEEGKS